MDFEAYETFLENMPFLMRGINRLIQKAKGEKGKRFVWSPIATDIVMEGPLNHVEQGFVYTDIKDIPPAILEYLDYENYVVELVYINTHNGSHYLLSIGY